MTNESVRTTVRDGRNFDLSLDNNGFELIPSETKLETSDFYSDEANIKSSYYQEMEELVKFRTGAAKVVAFNHVVRNQASKGKGDPNLITNNCDPPDEFG